MNFAVMGVTGQVGSVVAQTLLSRALVAALHKALSAAQPKKIVCLSTIGAQCTRPNLLGQLRIMEQEFHTLPMPVIFLRPGWFLEGDIQWNFEKILVSADGKSIQRFCPRTEPSDPALIAAIEASVPK